MNFCYYVLRPLTVLQLKLMASVRETQPMIQLLLSTPDYVAALDLIQTSQEMLKQELPGILSFRLVNDSFDLGFTLSFKVT